MFKRPKKKAVRKKPRIRSRSTLKRSRRKYQFSTRMIDKKNIQTFYSKYGKT